MFKYVIALSLLAGCLENPFVSHCNDPDHPHYPTIGGCVEGAPQGTAGGPCSGSLCGDASLQCIGGTCYPCGAVTNPPEPCCGGQMASDHGSCPGGGQCELISAGTSDGWFVCTNDASPPHDCAGEQPNYYVYVLSSTCDKVPPVGFCAASDADAQAYVDQTYDGVEHGPIATDPNSNTPPEWYACGTGSGSECVVGSSDDSKVTTFWAYTHDQVLACEQQLDSGCTWADGQDGGKTAACQPAM
jgi:hypothetical protein